MMASLFDPIRIGDFELSNRIVMAPLTRSRAGGEGRVPNELMAQYYAQRASAGLIVSEATAVIPQGVGYANTPGIWSAEQVQGWKKVTDAVHAAGGKIILQLWHVGRISDPVFLDGELPVAPSAIAAEGHVSLLRPMRPFVTPRALERDEIPAIVEGFRKGAENAKEAGFDGVEIHAANGYLLDQFLQDGVNKRTDDYGGSVENRARLLLEVADACISVWGAGRVGVHLAPRSPSHSMSDSNPVATFGYVAQQLGERGIAFIFSRDPIVDDELGGTLRKNFGGAIIANEEMSKERAEQLIADNKAEAVAFGRLFIANPDLPARFKADADFNDPHPETFMQLGAEGYVDYPSLSEAMA